MNTIKLKEYIELLKQEQERRLENKFNFEKFVNKSDADGLISLGKSIREINIEYKITANIIFNIEGIIKKDDNQ